MFGPAGFPVSRPSVSRARLRLTAFSYASALALLLLSWLPGREVRASGGEGLKAIHGVICRRDGPAPGGFPWQSLLTLPLSFCSPPLTSWKEIAQYLGINVRTAQKCERERGLPVRRASGARSRVSPDTASFEVWKQQNPFWEVSTGLLSPIARSAMGSRWRSDCSETIWRRLTSTSCANIWIGQD